MPGSTRKGILKNTDRDKQLPAVPSTSPLAVESNGKTGSFIPFISTATIRTPRSSRVPSNSKPVAAEGLVISDSYFLRSSSAYKFDELVDERPWIRGGSSSAPSTRPASPCQELSIPGPKSLRVREPSRVTNTPSIPLHPPTRQSTRPRSQAMKDKERSPLLSKPSRTRSRTPRYAGSTSRSELSSAAPSPSSSRISHQNIIPRRIPRRPSLRAKAQSVQGLRLPKKRISTTNNTTTANTLLKGPPNHYPKNIGSSPLLVPSSQSRLRRRPRVCKRGSVSESDHGITDMRIPMGVNEDTHPSQYLISTSSPHLIIHASPTPPMYTPTQRSSHLYNEAPTVYSLPLILPADQEYECHVEWEPESNPELDAAERLWRKLENECGLASPSRFGDDEHATPRRGRWRVKVTETPVIPVADDHKEHSAGNIVGIGNVDYASPMEGLAPVLREVEDLIPPINEYERLAAMVTRRKRSGFGSRSKVKRTKSRNSVHSDIKRALREVWKDQPLSDSEEWTNRLEMLKSRSTCASVMTRANSRWSLARSSSQLALESTEYFISAAGEGPTGLGITMNRSVTLSSAAADSMIDFYLDRGGHS